MYRFEREQEETIHNRITLKESIRRLHPRHRAVLALRMAGFTQKDCGIVLGVTRPAIGHMHRRALEEIRKAMEEHGPQA